MFCFQFWQNTFCKELQNQVSAYVIEINAHSCDCKGSMEFKINRNFTNSIATGQHIFLLWTVFSVHNVIFIVFVMADLGIGDVGIRLFFQSNVSLSQLPGLYKGVIQPLMEQLQVEKMDLLKGKLNYQTLSSMFSNTYIRRSFPQKGWATSIFKFSSSCCSQI